jgi:hypothetical protein
MCCVSWAVVAELIIAVVLGDMGKRAAGGRGGGETGPLLGLALLLFRHFIGILLLI